RRTGLPFVYAVWAGRKDALAPGDVAALQASLARGLAARGAIARGFAEAHGGGPNDVARYEKYLRHHIKYSLGSDELAGLSEYFLRAKRARLLEHAPEIEFYDAPVPRAPRD